VLVSKSYHRIAEVETGGDTFGRIKLKNAAGVKGQVSLSLRGKYRIGVGAENCLPAAGVLHKTRALFEKDAKLVPFTPDLQAGKSLQNSSAATRVKSKNIAGQKAEFRIPGGHIFFVFAEGGKIVGKTPADPVAVAVTVTHQRGEENAGFEFMPVVLFSRFFFGK